MKIKPDKEGRDLIKLVKSLNLKINNNNFGYIDLCQCKKLREHGFYHWKTGGFKSVWLNSKYRHYVLKIYFTKTGHKTDCKPLKSVNLRKHYLIPIYRSKTFLIQHKARRVKATKKTEEFALRFPCDMDVCLDNIGRFKGKLVLIDYLG